jgi:thioredoxin reductase (NADPH)
MARQLDQTIDLAVAEAIVPGVIEAAGDRDRVRYERAAGTNFVSQQVTGLGVRGPGRLLRVSDGSEIAARTVIIATGVTWRRLDTPGLEALRGAGVYYGAAGAEAPAMEGRDVFVVGAGNSAGQAVVHLARYARSVSLLVRGDALATSMSDYLVRELGAIPNVAVRLRTEVVNGLGHGSLERITLRDRRDGVATTVPAAGLFIMIGGQPRTAWLAGSVQRDRQGYILTGRDLLRQGALPAEWPLPRPPLLVETSVPGVFAVADVRAGSVKRVASAAGAGAIAVQLVHEYLSEERG